ncbi:unnamed protein product, partial [Amoebophrya sp. A120]
QILHVRVQATDTRTAAVTALEWKTEAATPTWSLLRSMRKKLVEYDILHRAA